MITLAFIFLIIGALGMCLAVGCKIYSRRSIENRLWDETAHDLAMRATLIIVIGFVMLIFSTWK